MTDCLDSCHEANYLCNKGCDNNSVNDFEQAQCEDRCNVALTPCSEKCLELSIVKTIPSEIKYSIITHTLYSS